MNEETKNILEESMKDIVLEAVKEVDIKGIMTAQIKSVTESIARDMFCNYGDFRKELETKLKKEITFNIDNISVPNFGEIAIDTVKAELSNMELENKEDIEKRTSQRLSELLGNGKENITCTYIEDSFAKIIYKELEYKMDDNCRCGDEPSINTFGDLLDLAEYNLSDFEMTSTLEQKSRNWGADWNACNTDLVLNVKYKDANIYNIALKLDRVRDKEAGEDFKDDDYFVEDRKNIYTIISVEVNGESLHKDGTIYLKKASTKLEQMLLTSYLNGVKIDMNIKEHTEIEED